jgi:Ala-tRNA(Pro) deacylase
MPSRKVKTYLDAAGIKYDVIEHTTVYTAQEVAAVTHIKGNELVKAIMAKVDGELVMLVLPSTCKINFELLRQNFEGKKVTLAREEEFSPLFPDCETGAMPPLGKLYDVNTIVDESLADDREIVFKAGTHHDIIKISFEDYKRIENPKMASFTTHI